MHVSRIQIPERIARVSLIAGPTPVQRLANAYPHYNVWIKDDSKTHTVYGGNKPRKLEFLLTAAQREEKDVLTFGFESSNHALATAYHAKKLGLKTHLVLIRGPHGLSAHDQEKLDKKMRLVQELAHKIHIVNGFKHAPLKGILEWLKSAGQLYLIPPGGSNALGSLGFVAAAFELKQQMAESGLAEFEKIFVPLGTAGTAVGLAVGLKAVGLRAQVIAVKVVPGFVNERPALLKLAKKIRALVPELPLECAMLDNLVIEDRFLGGGYGQPLDVGTALIEKFAACENISLEDTYTAKALAAMEAQLTIRSEAPVLFWNTYGGFKEN